MSQCPIPKVWDNGTKLRHILFIKFMHFSALMGSVFIYIWLYLKFYGMSIYESNKKSDNDALNEILDNVESINKKVGLFYYLAILAIILYIISLILPYVSSGTI
jgi:hypothetical protein